MFWDALLKLWIIFWQLKFLLAEGGCIFGWNVIIYL